MPEEFRLIISYFTYRKNDYSSEMAASFMDAAISFFYILAHENVYSALCNEKRAKVFTYSSLHFRPGLCSFFY